MIILEENHLSHGRIIQWLKGHVVKASTNFTQRRHVNKGRCPVLGDLDTGPLIRVRLRLEPGYLNTAFVVRGQLIKPPLVTFFVTSQDDNLMRFGELFENKIHH